MTVIGGRMALQDRPARVPRGYRADRGAMSYFDIETNALNARRQLAPDVPLDAAPPSVALFENLDRWRMTTTKGATRLSYGVVELPLGVEARTRYEQESNTIAVELSATAYANLENNQGRARHTVHHEIGHVVLHTEQLLRISVIPHAEAEMARTSTHRFCEDTEWQADSFAAAFAMPAQGLVILERRGTLTVETIAAAMQVSMEAASNRLDTFNNRRASLLKAK